MASKNSERGIRLKAEEVPAYLSKAHQDQVMIQLATANMPALKLIQKMIKGGYKPSSDAARQALTRLLPELSPQATTPTLPTNDPSHRRNNQARGQRGSGGMIILIMLMVAAGMLWGRIMLHGNQHAPTYIGMTRY